jgi:hypothetical protein
MDQIPNQSQQKKNPLTSFYRQPKIYVKLPSKGEFYPPGSLDVSVNGEYPVYAMTAKDELLFKTPDALLSGQSTVELIKSCIPAITNPWAMPNIDLDFALISIRIATYGDKMEVGCNCPHCEAENNYDIDLTAWFGVFNNFHYEKDIPIDQLTVHVRPYTYKEVTKTAIQTMEQQRIFQIINDDTITDEDFFPLTSLVESSATSSTCPPRQETPEKEKIYCNCGQPNDPSRSMICCDNTTGCTHPYSGGWYHYSCVGLTEDEAEEIITKQNLWICRHCEVTEAKRNKK